MGLLSSSKSSNRTENNTFDNRVAADGGSLAISGQSTLNVTTANAEVLEALQAQSSGLFGAVDRANARADAVINAALGAAVQSGRGEIERLLPVALMGAAALTWIIWRR